MQYQQFSLSTDLNGLYITLDGNFSQREKPQSVFHVIAKRVSFILLTQFCIFVSMCSFSKLPRNTVRCDPQFHLHFNSSLSSVPVTFSRCIFTFAAAMNLVSLFFCLPTNPHTYTHRLKHIRTSFIIEQCCRTVSRNTN